MGLSVRRVGAPQRRSLLWPRPSRRVLAGMVERRPLRFTVVLLFGYVTVLLLSTMSLGDGVEREPWRRLLVEVPPLAVAAALLSRLGWWREAGFIAPRRWRDVGLVPLAFLPVLSALYVFPRLPGPEDAALMLVAPFWVTLTALQEESVSRGLVLRTWLPRGPRRAAAVAAVFFALTHVVHVQGGASMALLTVASGATGFLLAAVRLRTGAIWPCVAAHALTNLVAITLAFRLDPGLPGLVPFELIVAALMILVARRLLRDDGRTSERHLASYDAWPVMELTRFAPGTYPVSFSGPSGVTGYTQERWNGATSGSTANDVIPG